MIEKMKFLSITGPKSDIDRVVNEYLAKYEIHLENAMAQLTQVQHLSPYIQINPYKELLNKATEFAGLLQNTEDVPVRDISLDEATGLIDSLSQKLSDINAECDDLKAQALKKAFLFFLLCHMPSYLSKSFSMRLTETSVDTPFSCIVIPYRRSAAVMVPLLCVIIINCVFFVNL